MLGAILLRSSDLKTEQEAVFEPKNAFLGYLDASDI